MTKSATISFVGDMSISWRQWPNFVAQRAGWTDGGVAPLLAQSSLNIGNLECVPLPINWPLMGQRFSTVSAEALDYFAALGVRCFTLANNHIMDVGADGLAAVIREIEARGLQYFGAGQNRDAAEAPLLLTIADQRIALLGACDASYAWATAKAAGVAPMIDSRLMARLREIRDHVDQTIFVLHAGAEFYTMAERPRVKFCRALADAGAAAIYQHHPHVVQPYEIWNKVPIFYSLGNFCFEIDGNRYMEHRPHVRDGLIAHHNLISNIIPRFDMVTIDGFGRPHLCEESTSIENILQAGAAILQDPKNLQAAWQKCADSESRILLADTYWTMRRNGIGAGLAALRHSLRQPRLRDCLRTAISRGLL